MKKIYILLLCAVVVCSMLLSCEKEKDDKEIENDNPQETAEVERSDDDPNNGYSDLYGSDK